MDDIISGADHLEQSKHRVNVLNEAFESGCFPLRKWATNSEELAKYIEHTVPSVKPTYTDTKAKLLGIRWDQTSDSISVFLEKAISELKNNAPFKRLLLKGLAQVFDPIGLLSPIVINAKI